MEGLPHTGLDVASVPDTHLTPALQVSSLQAQEVN